MAIGHYQIEEKLTSKENGIIIEMGIIGQEGDGDNCLLFVTGN